ncbi:MAG: beta-galactosidase, partial [Acidobacteriota bacterium]|nr:beta-galactosidase [Acidobacteriota bacterium]
GEFAWSSMEPEEGRYTLDWLERAIALAASHHMTTVLGTPTDAPPAWLTSKYPETLRVDEEGRRLQHGSRRQFSYASMKYRALCRAVVEQMARRFGRNPNVAGWQIGNEYTEDSFDADAVRQFHEWLRAKYGTLEALNRRWATAYWSQTYDRWDEIPMGTGRGNPGLLLDYKRFVTDEWRSFQRNQLEAIRGQAGRGQFVTTNLGGLGWANRFNRTDIAADLDLISWDAYVGQGHLEPYRMGATHDLARGWKQRNFWVMEMQPGNVDWAGVSNSLDPGETRAMAWQAVGHGADAIAFWQWRSALNGQEQYHGSLAGPDGGPLPFYAEARQIGEDFAKAGEALRGTAPESQVAILHDYDSRWAIDFHRQTNRYDQLEVLLGYYRPLRDLTQAVDIVDPRAELGRYKLVAAPGLNVISGALAARLQAWVEGGGTLVLGPRSGMKDEFNALDTRRQPGALAAALGARVEQFYALLEDVPVAGEWGKGKAAIWAERLAPAAGTETVMQYGAGNGWLEGRAAVVVRRLGKGRIAYIGAVLDAGLMRAAARWMVETAGVKPETLAAPEGVEVCRRVGPGREVWIVINHGRGTAKVTLPRAMEDVLNGGEVREREIAPQGVAVVSVRR